MNDDLGNLTIGALAKAAGVCVETIRSHQRKALLPQAGAALRRHPPLRWNRRRAGEVREIGPAARFQPG